MIKSWFHYTMHKPNQSPLSRLFKQLRWIFGEGCIYRAFFSQLSRPFLLICRRHPHITPIELWISYDYAFLNKTRSSFVWFCFSIFTTSTVTAAHDTGSAMKRHQRLSSPRRWLLHPSWVQRPLYLISPTVYNVRSFRTGNAFNR